MEQTRRLTAIIEREDDGFVALLPGSWRCQPRLVDPRGASQSDRGADAVFEIADESEISRRVHREVFVTQVEVPVR